MRIPRAILSYCLQLRKWRKGNKSRPRASMRPDSHGAARWGCDHADVVKGAEEWHTGQAVWDAVGLAHPGHRGERSDDGGDSGDCLKNQEGEVYFERMRNRQVLDHILKAATDNFKNVTSISDARRELGLDGTYDMIKGMSIRLLPHQVIGVNWMVKQERDAKKKGGILADDMGLGKTVQMISTMVKARPITPREVGSFERAYSYVKQRSTEAVADSNIRRTTLVLAPVALLQQWHDEIIEKTEPGTLKVHIHHGEEKLKKVSEIQNYDVVITSYRTFVSVVPSAANGRSASKHGGRLPSRKKSPRVGLLGKIKWLRVVIDEAQNIRNRETQISRAVATLDSEYRWCLTGTPVTNSLSDLYAFTRFCKIEPWDDWKIFHDRIARDEREIPHISGRKAQTILRTHMLRRLKGSTIDGKPILQLAPKNIDVVVLNFARHERSIYNHMEKRHQAVVSKLIEEGTVGKNYEFVFKMILRLRQLCCHPGLFPERAKDEDDIIVDDATRERELKRARKMMGDRAVSELLQLFRDRARNHMKDEHEGNDCRAEEDSVNKRKESIDALHFVGMNFAQIVSMNYFALTWRWMCPVCHETLDYTRIFNASVFEPTQEDLDKIYAEISERRSNTRKATPGNSQNAMENELTVAEFEVMLKRSRLEPSTKMMHTIELIRHWRKEAPDDRVIVYSQWTSMLDLVEKQLELHNIANLRYDGKMTRMERVGVVSKLNASSGPRVILISLRCGGVGLNLTAANRIINLDLSWNYAVEAQAYDRVHRLGQIKPVEVKRLVIANTIEERIMQLQELKQDLSDAALGEGRAGKIKRLTVREIAQLFNLNADV